MGRPPVATEIRIRRGTACLEVAFEDGRRVSLPAEYLRVESPSAEVQGHAPEQKVLVAGKQDVNIDTVEPIGNYAIRIRFTDGHDTGLYSWAFLQQLAAEYDQRWQAYVEALAARGLRRSH
jgi:DUF971 family protein